MVVSLPPAAQAQAVVDPHYVQFKPSPDHHVVSNGLQVVSRYDLEFFLLGGLIPLEVINIGKPAPASDGNIYVSFQPTFPSPGVLYEARVMSVGPGGSIDSAASNSFSFTGACGYVLSTTAMSASAAGGPFTLDVLTSSGCVWNPSTSSTWITVLTNSTSGAGAVSLHVAANPSGSARVGYVSLAGQTVTVAQAGAQGGACAASALTTSVSAAGSGLAGTIGVSAGAGCSWQASSPVSWVTVSPASGSGDGTVSFDVAANPSSTERTATLMVAGTSVTVKQAASGSSAPGPSAGCAVPTKTSLSIAAGGGSGAIALTADGACTWAAASPVNWVALSPPSGKGPGSVTYTLLPNAGTSRTTTVMIGGSPVSVTQAGTAPGCGYAVSTPSASVIASGGSGSIGVITQAGCSWKASTSSSWLILSPASGVANGSVTYKATANNGATSRLATLTIAGHVVMLSQAGASSPGQCVRTVSTSHISAPAAASSGAITMGVSGCEEWNASSPVSWVRLSPTSGSSTGNVKATYTIAANKSSNARTVTLTVNGQAVTVTQAGATGPSACSYALSTASARFASAGGNGWIKVTTSSGCTWASSDNAPWLSISRGDGNSTGTLAYSVAKNSSGAARTGTLTIAGKTVTISQAR